MPTKSEAVAAVRLVQLRRFVPEVFGSGTLLYVGASAARSHCLPELIASGREVTILEAWPMNVAHYASRRDLRVICGDVRMLSSLDLPRYDVAFWWHGPEHIARTELPRALAALETSARLIVLACPWGQSDQGALGGNPYEVHKSTLYPADFVGLGYSVDAIGQAGGRSSSNLIAVKRCPTS